MAETLQESLFSFGSRLSSGQISFAITAPLWTNYNNITADAFAVMLCCLLAKDTSQLKHKNEINLQEEEKIHILLTRKNKKIMEEHTNEE